MKYLILLLILISCNPSRKLDKLNKKHPELLANFCKDTFPCVTSKVDTLTNIEYDFIEVQCPGYDYNSAIIDTVWLTSNKTQIIEGPAIIVTEQHTNFITKLVRDSAEVKSCQLEVIRLNEKCKELTLQNVKLQNKVTAKNRWIMWVIIALLCTIIGNILQLKK